MPLDYNSSIPLHVQLKEEIEKKILTRVYTDQIPSEHQFVEEYNVSRSTVRRSIEQLVHEGILKKKHGRGTFVAIKPMNDWLGSLSSTHDMITRMGMQPGARLIESMVMTPGPELQQHIQLDEVYYIARLRYANQIPIGIERHYFPVALGKRLAKLDLKDVSIYTLLETELDILTSEADQVITSLPFSDKDAELLDFPENMCALNTKLTITDVDGKIVEFEDSSYRSDMYSFQINLSRKSNR